MEHTDYTLKLKNEQVTINLIATRLYLDAQKGNAEALKLVQQANPKHKGKYLFTHYEEVAKWILNS